VVRLGSVMVILAGIILAAIRYLPRGCHPLDQPGNG
jgi:hypothetical protein